MGRRPSVSDPMVNTSFGTQFRHVVRRLATPASGDVAARFSGDPCARLFPAPGGKFLEGDLRLITTGRTSAASAFAMFETREFQDLEDENPMSTGINVVDEFGVDPTGGSNCTAQILAAIAGTTAGDLLYFPGTNNGASSVYLVTPDTIDFSQRVVVGSNAALGSTFKAASAGTYLITTHGALTMSGFRFDCDNVCETGLYANAVSGQFDNLLVTKNTQFGYLWKEGPTNCSYCFVQTGNKGHKLLGPSFAQFNNCGGIDLQGVSLEWIGGAATSPGTTQSGVAVLNMWGSDICGQAGGPQMLLRGLEGGILNFAYVEWGTAGDGIEMAEDCHNMTIQGAWFVNGSTSIALHQTGRVQGCTFINNSLGTGGAGPVIVNDDSKHHHNNTYIGNTVQTRTDGANAPVTVSLNDGGTPFVFTPRGGIVTASAAPTKGHWNVGDRVWNNGAKDGPIGWYCSSAGTSPNWTATWQAFG